jgi:predicted permease
LTDIELAHWKSGVIAAILAPITGLLAAWLAIELLGLEGINQQVILLFGVLPPAIMNFLMAERYQQHPQAVASIVAFANLAALISVPLLLRVIL